MRNIKRWEAQDYHCACCGAIETGNGKYDMAKNTMVCTSCGFLLIAIRPRPNILEIIAAYEQSPIRPDPKEAQL